MRIAAHRFRQHFPFLATLLVSGWGECCSCVAATGPLSLFQFQEAAMATRFTIQVYAGSEDAVRPAITAAWKRLNELNRIFSDYDPESELVRLCQQPPGLPIALSPELYDILAISQSVAQFTQGAFDFTLGPLKRLWKQSGRDGRLPSAEKMKDAMSRTGFQKLQLHPDGTASLLVTGMRLDLGGIAKGYAARDLVRLITSYGFPAVLVAASGDIAVGKAPPDQNGWTVGIATADRPFEMPPHSALSTSGDSEQFFEMDGKRYSHILNPKTGLGLTHRTIVSVHGPDATLTDALATAVSVMGSPDQLPEPIRRQYRFWLLPPTKLE